MKRKGRIITIAIMGIIFCPILLLFQCPSIPLMVDGKVVAVARRSFIRPILNGGSVDVYVGEKRKFSLAQNFLDCAPIFIYPFADGQRFLCDVDDDVAMLDFVVDFGVT